MANMDQPPKEINSQSMGFSFPQVSLQEVEVLKKKLFQERGFDLSHYTPAYVQRRINACLIKKGCSFSEYLQLLKNSPEEYQKFLDSFTINVTEFFRDLSVWEALAKDHLPQILSKKLVSGDHILRIWSAGCSSGEEPYSIAIMVSEVMDQLKIPSHFLTEDGNSKLAGQGDKTAGRGKFFVSIHATDIDNDSLAKARAGIYSKENLKNINPMILQKYFSIHVPQDKDSDQKSSEISSQSTRFKDHERIYQVSDKIKKMIAFEKHHFFNNKPFEQLDMIFCRNVTIYLTPENKDKLMEVFYRSLAPDGLLVIGKTETILSKARYFFYSVNSKEHIFRKEKRDAKNQVKVTQDKRKNFFWSGQ